MKKKDDCWKVSNNTTKVEVNVSYGQAETNIIGSTKTSIPSYDRDDRLNITPPTEPVKPDDAVVAVVADQIEQYGLISEQVLRHKIPIEITDREYDLALSWLEQQGEIELEEKSGVTHVEDAFVQEEDDLFGFISPPQHSHSGGSYSYKHQSTADRKRLHRQDNNFTK